MTHEVMVDCEYLAEWFSVRIVRAVEWFQALTPTLSSFCTVFKNPRYTLKKLKWMGMTSIDMGNILEYPYMDIRLLMTE